MLFLPLPLDFFFFTPEKNYFAPVNTLFTLVKRHWLHRNWLIYPTTEYMTLNSIMNCWVKYRTQLSLRTYLTALSSIHTNWKPTKRYLHHTQNFSNNFYICINHKIFHLFRYPTKNNLDIPATQPLIQKHNFAMGNRGKTRRLTLVRLSYKGRLCAPKSNVYPT